MLEILYDTTNNRIRGWCGDSNQFGNFYPKPNQAVVVWDVPIPPKADWYEVDLVNETVIPNPDYKPKKKRNLEKEIDEVNSRLGKLEIARVQRVAAANIAKVKGVE